MWTNKKGISPIVGVILVVAMTVLLAAIAWTYMGGFTKTSPKIYQVAVRVSEEVISGGTHRVVVTYLGGPDQDKVVSITISGVNSTGGTMTFTLEANNSVSGGPLQLGTNNGKSDKVQYRDSSGNWVNITNIQAQKIGNTYVIPVGLSAYSDNGTANKDHITVTATFLDGTSQTIYDDYI